MRIRTIPGGGNRMCKGPKAGVFLEKRRRPVWLEPGRELGTRRKWSRRDFERQGQGLGMWLVGFHSLTLAFTLECNEVIEDLGQRKNVT